MPPKIISVTSGKGGVGKTLSTVHMALLAQLMGKRVLIFDGDLGLSNVDIVMGLRPRFSLRDVLDGNASLVDIMVEDPSGVKIISSGSGISSLSNLSQSEKSILIEQCKCISQKFDLTFIDTGAGISDNVIQLNSLSDQVLVVTTPEPHALTDAYAVIKVIAEQSNIKSFLLLVNQTRSSTEALKIHERISDVSSRFLNIKVNFAGHVPMDPEIPLNVLRRKLQHKRMAQTISGQAWQQALLKILESPITHRSDHTGSVDLGDFWSQLIHTTSMPQIATR
jgi:flagellar biosynthesis protein FlhG